MPAEQILARRPAAVILSGGPASVYAEGAPPAPPGLLDAGVPVLGICYGFQLMVSGLGGSVAHTGAGEYGATRLELLPPGAAADSGEATCRRTLLSGLPSASRSGCRTATPARWRRRVHRHRAHRGDAGGGDGSPGPGLYGVQFHPEVLHTEHGMEMLRRFLSGRRVPPELDDAEHHRRADRPDRRARSAEAGPSAGCPAASTPRWPPRWCSAPSGPG